ncbi:hypothetical protein TCAL_00150 [Tigriopus californicus]|uniref:DDRGK domain-containing protein 1 n=1 Tax=Tigriopus californicus TaxID=6832 RepID=A0A553PGG3_TIGCA|nr:DDRGK domain-containing protein 1-like [Tigriopus californicus]TRY76771.1 hypothetical protein TCAL_00150 [Tigriopus californicus]|eukprot:TCALIF_00150-PA protein Name:"Similar to CG5862 DDRGK domain-containing protein 1 (Drosophila melanogaster)" AED:0.01 eAED:0.01 QI:208/1/1/1/1/1/2/90/293
MDPLVLSVLVAVLAVALAALLYYKKTTTAGRAPSTRSGPVPAGAVAAVAGGRRRAGPRLRRAAQRGDAVEDEAAEAEEAQAAEREELAEAGVKVPDGKVGKKKMEKLQLKAEKKVAREAEAQEREERKKQQEKDQALAAEARQREQNEAEREAAEEQRLKEEQQRRDNEEYMKLKAAFSVEAEGFDENEDPGDAQNQLRNFIQYIQDTKVVVLEDLAAHFKMKTQDTIDRVTQLQEDGLLTGVIDDRGKFIFISQKELEAVATFIRQRGRVSIAELAESSNQLITLTPEATVS